MNLLGLTCLVLIQGTPETQEREGLFRFSPGPHTALLERVQDSTPAAPTAATPWPAWGPEGWGEPAPWDRWTRLLQAERGGQAAAPGRRAELARLALVQSRHFDAWAHLAQAAAEPQVLAGLLPSFVPGIPAGHAVGPGGRPAPLPSAAILSPGLPPPRDADAARPGERSMSISTFEVADAQVSMEVALEPDGVQVDLVLLEGEGARLFVRVPNPPGMEPLTVYGDWERLEPGPDGVEVQLDAQHASFAIWARFRPRRDPWPDGIPERLSNPIQRHGFQIRSATRSPGARPLLEGLATSIASLLEVPCEVAQAAAGAPGTTSAVVLSFPPEDPLRKITGLVSGLEGFVLGRP